MQFKDLPEFAQNAACNLLAGISLEASNKPTMAKEIRDAFISLYSHDGNIVPENVSAGLHASPVGDAKPVPDSVFVSKQPNDDRAFAGYIRYTTHEKSYCAQNRSEECSSNFTCPKSIPIAIGEHRRTTQRNHRLDLLTKRLNELTPVQGMKVDVSIHFETDQIATIKTTLSRDGITKDAMAMLVTCTRKETEQGNLSGSQQYLDADPRLWALAFSEVAGLTL